MRRKWVTAVAAGGLLAALVHADADHDYHAGTDAAHQAMSAGTPALNSARPASIIPGYTASPAQSAYYGGVAETSDMGLRNKGATAWSQSEAGIAVSTSVANNPGEKISQDAPFIKAGRDVEERADSLVGNQGKQCSAQNITRSQFTRYTCERDLKVEQFCTRTAVITGHDEDTTEIKQMIIDSLAVPFSTQNGSYAGVFASTLSGTVIATSATYSWRKDLAYSNPNWFMQVSTPFGLIAMDNSEGNFSLGVGVHIIAGQALGFSIRTRSGVPAVPFVWNSPNMHYRFTVTATVQNPGKKWVAGVAWEEICPFSKAEGARAGSVCTAPGEDRAGVMDGHPYTVHQDCWGWRDAYITQSDSPGTCQAYLSNPACQLVASRCAYTSETGACLHQNATWSCETRTAGQQMVCGGEIYCLDGDCDKARTGISNDFGKAVSQLAALAAGGKDVAALNGKDVKAFTGQAKFCKKFATGFSNCCRDGGWGQDAGLSQCSSEEKALGKAKENRLTVSVGEFCSKKLLGVCLEKMRGYCQFGSKLAQIAQEQGRAWQLGIGFGSASSPDCRGMTVPELQAINFGTLDFSSFTDDLMKNQKIPGNAALLNKVNDQIQRHLKSLNTEGQ